MARLLLLEDDEAIAIGIEFTLMDEGYEVKRVSLVSEAKEAFDEEDFDLVILDITLPDGNGYDVCRYIRRKSEVPIIFLTALDEEVNVVLGLEIGGDDYITKPFRARELLARIKVLLRRTSNKNKDSEVYISGKIELNSATAKVYKEKKEILLTAQEYRLLLLFMNNPNTLLDRDTILSRIWDDAGSFIDNNTLSVYIRRLREKIEDDLSNPEYIVTHRGLGYTWNKKVVKE